MSKDVYFLGSGKCIESLEGASGAEAFARAAEIAPKQAYFGYFLFGFLEDGKSTQLNFGFPSVRFPELGDAVFVNYSYDSDEVADDDLGWAIRHGDSDLYYPVQEDQYAHERNFIPEAVAIQALDYFLKTGDRDPSLPWEPYKFYDPVFGHLYENNGRG